ncbi:MAG: hypothetical protein ABIJ18_04865 [archaeon]
MHNIVLFNLGVFHIIRTIIADHTLLFDLIVEELQKYTDKIDIYQTKKLDTP